MCGSLRRPFDFFFIIIYSFVDCIIGNMLRYFGPACVKGINAALPIKRLFLFSLPLYPVHFRCQAMSLSIFSPVNFISGTLTRNRTLMLSLSRYTVNSWSPSTTTSLPTRGRKGRLFESCLAFPKVEQGREIKVHASVKAVSICNFG